MIQTQINLINRLGLHARAAGKLVRVAADFQCDVFLTHRGQRVNAKSIMGILMLAAPCGSELILEADGVDAEAASAAITTLINNRFGEDE